MKRKGICFVCGCTQEDACDEGCGWANIKQTLCTACAPLDESERRKKRAENLTELATRRDMVRDELAALQERSDRRREIQHARKIMNTTTASQLRPELEELPDRMTHLPVHRGYPVPWFVAWIDGVPEFRCMDRAKRVRAVQAKLCWVCGQPLGRFMTFVAGPMCGVNRTSAEPPCHKECAQWSVRNCPFLSKPQMERRENDLPEGIGAPGHSIKRNPGVSLLWTTRSYELFSDGRGDFLFEMGDPESVEWWALGKPATRAQVEESVRTGLPFLEKLAAEEEGGIEAIHEAAAKFQAFWPAA